MLLLSDGANTTGDYEPLEAAQKAKDASVPVYTVALGTAEGTIEGPDGYGGTRTIRVPPDPETLAQVAESTGGKFFEAADQDALESVYDEIGSQVGRRARAARADVSVHRRRVRRSCSSAARCLALWFARIP